MQMKETEEELHFVLGYIVLQEYVNVIETLGQLHSQYALQSLSDDDTYQPPGLLWRQKLSLLCGQS